MNYKELQQKKNRDEIILKNLMSSNEKGIPYKNSEEQIIEAQKQISKKEDNKFFEERYLPNYASILSPFFLLVSLITFPMRLSDGKETLIAVIAFISLLAIIVIGYALKKNIDKIYGKDYFIFKVLNRYSISTFVFAYMFTALGDIAPVVDKNYCRWMYFIYFTFIFCLIIALVFDIVIPLKRRRGQYRTNKD